MHSTKPAISCRPATADSPLGRRSTTRVQPVTKPRIVSHSNRNVDVDWHRPPPGSPPTTHDWSGNAASQQRQRMLVPEGLSVCRSATLNLSGLSVCRSPISLLHCRWAAATVTLGNVLYLVNYLDMVYDHATLRVYVNITAVVDIIIIIISILLLTETQLCTSLYNTFYIINVVYFCVFISLLTCVCRIIIKG